MAITKHTVYVNHDHGYSGAFSWWRSNMDYRFWLVCGYGEFCESGRAVTDDFGTLVKVPA